MSMQNLRNINTHAADYLEKVNPKIWVSYKIWEIWGVHTHDYKTNGAAEAINNKHIKARFFAPLHLAAAVVQKQSSDIAKRAKENEDDKSDRYLTNRALTLVSSQIQKSNYYASTPVLRNKSGHVCYQQDPKTRRDVNLENEFPCGCGWSYLHGQGEEVIRMNQ